MPRLSSSSAPRLRPPAGGARRYRWRLVALGLLITVLIVAVHVFSHHDPARNTVLTRIEAMWYDMRFQLLPPRRDASVPIVIVDLDEATQQREGRWPWDRRKVAQLVSAIQNYGAVLIGFDVVFSEPGGNPVRQILDAAELPAPIDRALSFLVDEFDGDAALARVLSDRTVLGYFFHADGGKAGSLPLPFLELPDAVASTSTLISMPDYTANLDVLTENAWFSGFVVAVPDADGIVRRMPLVMRYENGVYASLGLEMARLALGAPWLRLGMEERGGHNVVTGVQVGRHLQVPLDERGNMLVPYRGRAGSFTTVSATGVLRGDAPVGQLGALDGAIVLVGTSALGLSDLRTIPLQTGFPGVEVHANVIDTLVQQAAGAHAMYLHPDWEAGATLALLLVSGLLMAVMLPGRAPFVMLLLAAGWLGLIVGANLVLWHVWHLALPMGLQVLLVLSIGAMNIAGGYLVTNRQKRAIQTLFGEYVPADHVERMVANPADISLEGEQRTMTVLFADVRNFTALSEALSPTQLKAVLNRYLSAITEVIFQHHGTIDKYVGDLVMAFWNAPLDDPHHARHAVEAALAMQQRMVALRKEFAAEGLPEFHIGIGVNTGPMNVGDMGSQYRRAYTVLGDAVNLASRLESLTDLYGVPILVSDSTRKQAPGFIYRPVDLAQVKGRSQALVISQPLVAQADAGNTVKSTVQQFDVAVSAYQAGNWPTAQRLFDALARDYPDDPLCHLYLSRIAKHDGVAPAGWSAITVHDKK